METSRRRNIIFAIILGLVLFVLGAGAAVAGVFTGIVLFNGCMGANGPFNDTVGLVYLLGCWPLTLLAAAILPPVLLGRGKRKAALVAIVIGVLAAFTVYMAWFVVGNWAFC